MIEHANLVPLIALALLFVAIWGVIVWCMHKQRRKPGLSVLAMRNFTRNYMTDGKSCKCGK